VNYSPTTTALLAELGIPIETVRARGLTECVEADALSLDVAEISSSGREHRLVKPSCAAWRSMKSAAAGDGVELLIVSAFRSVERQASIVRAKLARGLTVDEILAVSAPPGFSEHHTGRALDIGTPPGEWGACEPVSVEFESTPAFSWLFRNADRFGFVMSYPKDNADGYEYEPWHWCHDGSGECPSRSA